MFEAITMAFLFLAPPLMVDQQAKGNLPTQPTTCKVEQVKAANGNYVYDKIIYKGQCA